MFKSATIAACVMVATNANEVEGEVEGWKGGYGGLGGYGGYGRRGGYGGSYDGDDYSFGYGGRGYGRGLAGYGRRGGYKFAEKGDINEDYKTYFNKFCSLCFDIFIFGIVSISS